MTKTRALTSFNKYSDAEFSVKMNLILNKLRNNQYFQQMYPTFNELEVSVSAFNTAYNNSSSRSKESISVKNTQRKKLTELMNRTADSVNAIANGNRDLLTTTGFSLTSDTPIDKNLGQVTGFSIDTEGIKGKMTLKCNVVKNVVNYLHQYTKGERKEGSEWTSVSGTNCKYTFDNLESGVFYMFRILAVGKDNTQNESSILASYVL